MAVHHYLKTINPYFGDLWEWKKTFEVRLNDRNFKVGDTLNLLEYDSIQKKFSGKKVVTRITYILSEFKGLQKNYIVMGLSEARLNIDYLDSTSQEYNPYIFSIECEMIE